MDLESVISEVSQRRGNIIWYYLIMIIRGNTLIVWSKKKWQKWTYKTDSQAEFPHCSPETTTTLLINESQFKIGSLMFGAKEASISLPWCSIFYQFSISLNKLQNVISDCHLTKGIFSRIFWILISHHSLSKTYLLIFSWLK